jgi:DNA-binding transcriptional ArsR family regulator
MAQPTGREVKDALNDQFARIGKAVASPKRLEILDLLGQGEHTVEGVAHATAMGLANTSAHLQALRAARLVKTRKEGTKVFYRLSGDQVSRFLVALRDLASGRLAEVERIVRDYFEARDRLEPVSREDLAKRIRRKEVVVVDVRPAEEYRAGHIPGAISLPLG